MHSETPLNLPARSSIVLIALLQGLALYAAQELETHRFFSNSIFSYNFHAWVLVIPSAVALTVVDLRDSRMWRHVALASLLVLALATWIGWNLQGGTALYAAPLRTPFSLGLAVAAFVALPWWQFRLAEGHWRATYSALFERAWQNGLTLALALAFTGLAWLMLWLCSALFQLVKVDFFQQLFRQSAFIALFTGSVLGFGVLLGRTQHRAMQITRQVLFAVCRALLPLLSVIALLFVLALPFTGLDALWNTRSAAYLLLTVLVLLVVFVNAVYQHEDSTLPYPRWLCRLVQASLLVLPVYAGLALYALGLRIGQYGWSVDRFWGMAVAVLASGYALGYALAALPHHGRWLQRLETVNRWMCWLVLLAAVLGNSPVLDPVRITLSSQLERLRGDPAQITAADGRLLRFELGRRGEGALRALQQDPVIRADPRAASILEQALAAENRHGIGGGHIDDGARDLASVQARIAVPPGQAPADADWWQAVIDRRVDAMQCLENDAPCTVLRRDLDGDGQDEMLLCRFSEGLWVMCRLHARSAEGWRTAGTTRFDADRDADTARAATALREGRLQLHRPRWPQLEAGGVRADIEHDRQFLRGQQEDTTP